MSEELFEGGGEMGELMRSLDWSQTSLGSVENWSQNLKTAVRIMLTSRQAMFVWWGEDKINLYNDAYRAILGGKHPQTLGQPAADVWREIWDQVGPRAESAIRNNKGTYDEALLLIMERNGYPEETYYTFSYSPVPDVEGKPGGIICANTEETQRIIGERQLALLKELASKTADARTFDEACTLSAACLATNPYDLPFGMIYLIEPQRQYAALAGKFGIESGHALTPEIVELNDPNWHFAEVVNSHESYLISDLDARFSDLPTGAWRRSPHQLAIIPIAPSGETGKAGILVAGLNPLRLFDDNYQRFLNLVSAQIAASIANAQAYEEERKRAEALAELDRAKTAFFSNISHEFRTPLTLMLSPLEDTIAKLDGTIPAQEREQLQLVQRNGMRLLKLVNSLLDFSRIEAGRVQAAYEPVDLANYTAELASTFRSLIERAEMSLIVECPPLPEAIYVDREMWEKIVLNLLSNAFKFTLAGTIAVRLRWIDSKIELSVADTGVGIPSAELPHLFERFHRVENSQGRSFEGSGIGLSLVQELVKLHGGAINVTSTSGQGSCFTVTIPPGTAHLPPQRIGANRTLASTALSAMSYVEEAQRWLPDNGDQQDLGVQSFASGDVASQPHLLLADDNADMRDYIRRLLSGSYTVQTVADGVTALTAIANNPPDLVLTDVMMPGMDGFELLRLLRSAPQTQAIPIILLSARAGEEARIEGLAAGADDYLIKPFSARELLARVETTLKLSQLRREALQREQTLRAASETAQQQAEAAFRRIDQLLESMSEAFIALDQDWRIIYQNAAAERINKKTRSQVLGKTLWEEWSAAVGSSEQQYRHAVAEQIAVHFEQRYYEPPDHDVWLEVHAYPFEEGLGIFYRDISDRKQAESAVLERSRLSTLSADIGSILIQNDALPDALKQCTEALVRHLDAAFARIWTLNPEKNVLELQASAGMYTHLDGSHSKVPLGQFKIGLIAQERQPHFTNNVIGDPLIHDQEWAVRERMVAFAGYPLIVENQVVGVMAVFSQHSLSEITVQAIASVADAVSSGIQRKQIAVEREHLLAQEQAARQAAESANRIKDEFLAVLSHELRSPLNPILGWSRLLLQGKVDAEKTKMAIATIERNAQLQVQLINDLLDMSRILRGKMSLSPTCLDLSQVIAAALETVQLAAQSKSIQIQTTVLPDVETVIGDAGRLQQVVWNLLSNAVKFTPQGGQITVTLTQTGTHAQIQVIDTGKGIRRDFLPYVFEHFRQEDEATTRRFGGLGLGMAIMRQIVEMHGGTVAVDSPGLGQGATFTVQIPLAPRLSELPTPKASPDLTLDLSGIHILVVDDQVDSREFVVFILEQANAIITSVSSGIEALQSIEQSVPDLVVSDIGMPDMDGYMLMQQIRAMPPNQGGNIPAIALTAYAREVDHRRALEAGFQRHISKPLEPNQFVQAVLSALQNAEPA